MIDRFFACCDCKIYVDAGGRWAYWTLEDAGIIEKGAPVPASAVFSAAEYWNPKENEVSSWLSDEVFPPVRLFLTEHEGHRVVFGDKDDFLGGDEDSLEWMAGDSSAAPSPRFLVERLGLKTWDEVSEYFTREGHEPWWMHPEEREAARRKFEELVKTKVAS